MIFQLNSTEEFKKQFDELDEKSKRIVHDKIQLIKQNPYRYKRLNAKYLSKLFRIRFSIQSKETRLIYAVIEPNIILICFIDRKKDYKDLEKYLKKLRKE